MLKPCVLIVLLLVSPALARRVEITIIHTTDLHGHVLPTRDYNGRDNVGGVLRDATLIAQIRKEHPNNLLVDCGDLFQGGPESFLTDGRLMIKVCEWLKYDAWCLGNHEFDWGLEKLAALHDSTDLTMLGANIGAKQGGVNRLAKVQPFAIKEIDGVKIAIVGLITPAVPSWSRPNLLGDQVFIGSVQALQLCMPAVRDAKPDIIVLATHQGLRNLDDHANEIRAIAAAFPEIQFIIGGHSHRPVEHDYVGKTLYTQAGYYGIWLGQLDIAFDTVTRQVISADAKLHNVDASVPFAPDLEKLCKSDLARAKTYTAQKLGTSTDILDAKPDKFGASHIQMLLSRAVAASVNCDIVLHGSLADDPLPAGEITMADVWRVVPYENTIGIVHITPEQIAKIIEENGEKTGAVHFMGAFGLHFDWEKGADGKKHAVKLRDADDRPLHGRKRYRVALHSYNLASGGRRFPTIREIADEPESRLEMTGIDTRTALIDYIKKNSPLKREEIMKGAQ
jgi:2',3'-cyclic-nucleotide 2'-phosphodiesterase (5'-nucleotidase family)